VHGAHWYHGRIYRRYIDPRLDRTRQLIAEMVQPDSCVLEVGSGTGALAMQLASRCRSVVGLDASAKMIRVAERARRGHPHGGRVQFLHADAARMDRMVRGHFDFAVASLFLHTLDEARRRSVLRQMQSLADRLILADVDAAAQTGTERLARGAVELAAGLQHFRHWALFLRQGGLRALVEHAHLDVERTELDERFGTLVMRTRPSRSKEKGSPS